MVKKKGIKCPAIFISYYHRYDKFVGFNKGGGGATELPGSLNRFMPSKALEIIKS